MTARKAYVRGKAVSCTLGDDLAAIVNALHGDRSDPVELPLSLIDLDYGRPYFRLPQPAGMATLGPEARFYHFLFQTVDQAVSDAGLERHEVKELPIFFGSTANDIPIYEENYRTSSHVLSQTSSGYGNIANEIALHLDTKAACYTFTTACTSSANGVLYAADMVSRGIIQRALVVGYDLFSNLGFYGFEALKLIAPPPLRPFDKNREGVIMGEGCGAVVLDKAPKSAADFFCLGGANACDTHSVTTHDPEGHAIAAVMQDALKSAGVEARAVTAVKAHATGSYHNDLTECSGLKKVFGDRMPPVTGLKSFIGHTVGACGVIELALFTEAVKTGFIPATLGFETFDEELAVIPITKPLEIDAGTFLLNYFGFGGNCVSLVVANQS
jgi:3-oxoacyl-[acyl-carrier-protein] synthase-1